MKSLDFFDAQATVVEARIVQPAVPAAAAVGRVIAQRERKVVQGDRAGRFHGVFLGSIDEQRHSLSVVDRHDVVPLIVSQRPFADDPGRVASGRVAGLRTGDGELEFTRAAQPLESPGFAFGQERVAARAVPPGA